MLTYKCVTPHKHSVALDGRVVGHILYLGTDKYQYRPKGASSAHWGPVYDTIDTVMDTLAIQHDVDSF